ncbi:MAG: hypothetical protein QXJ07_01390 [Candidatus Bathyarchaeia archaeon]
MSMREVFRIIYAPHKALREIIQKPRYKGPLIIMLLFVLSSSGFYYALSTRVYYDQTAPSLSEYDKWTEDVSLWYSNENAIVSVNTTDYIKGDRYGNKSIQFKLENSSLIYMELKIPETLNCIEPNHYTNLTFRIKIAEPFDVPSNMSIYLFSENSTSKYFVYFLQSIPIKIGIWDNKTILLEDFSSFDGNWANITSLMLKLEWPSNKNITVLVDGVFFHGFYRTEFEIYGGAVLLYSIVNAFMIFFMQWVIFGVILYLFLRLFKAQPVWKTMLVISGFALVALFVQNLILTGIVLAYPEIRLSLKTLGGVPGEGSTVDVQNYMSIIFIQYNILERIVYYVWVVILCSIAVRLLFNFPWAKGVSISLLSSMITVLAFRFLAFGMVWL